MVCLLQIDGISPTDVESTSVSLTPQIDYGSDGNTQNITGDSLKKYVGPGGSQQLTGVTYRL